MWLKFNRIVWQVSSGDLESALENKRKSEKRNTFWKDKTKEVKKILGSRTVAFMDIMGALMNFPDENR